MDKRFGFALQRASASSRHLREQHGREEGQEAGGPEFQDLREKGEKHPIEAVGRDLRQLMSWVQGDDDYVEGSAAR